MEVINAVKSLGYELIPLRPKDAVKLVSYIWQNTTTLVLFLFSSSSAVAKFIVKFLASLRATQYVYASIVLSLFAIACYLEFAQVFCITLAIWALFASLGKRKKGELSAFSVFNKGFKSLMGQMKGEMIDREIRNNAGFGLDHQDEDEEAEEDGEDEDEEEGEERRRAARTQQAQNQTQNHFKPIKRGKKARRTYEARMERRAQMRAAMGNNDNDEDEDDFEEW